MADTNYVPTQMTQDPAALQRYLTNEFRKISQSINGLQQQINTNQTSLTTLSTFAHSVGAFASSGGSGTNPVTIAAATTVFMMGMKVPFTPTRTGRIIAMANCTPIITAAGQVCYAQIGYGTGTAPGSGTAATGTGLPAQVQQGNNTMYASLTPYGVFTLAVGTAYWLDLRIEASTASSVGFYNPFIIAQEF